MEERHWLALATVSIKRQARPQDTQLPKEKSALLFRTAD